jgi:hypothetical protein
MSIKITEINYETYKKVYGIISDHLLKDLIKILPSTANPTTVLDEWEVKSKSLARRGLQTGLNDMLSSLKHCPKTILLEINSDLQKLDLPNLESLLNIIDKTITKVLRTKKIKNLDEYYIVKELLDDTHSEISEMDRSNLSKYFLDFELKVSRKEK